MLPEDRLGSKPVRLRPKRGRDGRYRPPPAQNRAGGIPAHGLYGAFFVKRASHHFFVLCYSILLFDPRREHSSAQRSEGSLPLGASNRANHACIRLNPHRVSTMKQSYASRARLRGGGSILPTALPP